MKKDNAVFHGFAPEMPELLKELRENNTKEWFDLNRSRYKKLVGEPLKALGESLAPAIAAIDNTLLLKFSRPNRDTRFSKDKSPYHTAAWLVFRHEGEWSEKPAFYVEISPSGWRYGMGFYAAKSRSLDPIRSRALQNPDRFLKALQAAEEAGFALQGERRARPVKTPAGTPEALLPFFAMKNFYFVQIEPYTPLFFRPDLEGRIRLEFEALAPIYRLFK